MYVHRKKRTDQEYRMREKYEEREENKTHGSPFAIRSEDNRSLLGFLEDQSANPDVIDRSHAVCDKFSNTSEANVLKASSDNLSNMHPGYDFAADHPRYTALVLGILSKFPTLPFEVVYILCVVLKITPFFFMDRLKLACRGNNQHPLFSEYRSLVHGMTDGVYDYYAIPQTHDALGLHTEPFDDNADGEGVPEYATFLLVLVDVVVTGETPAAISNTRVSWIIEDLR
ncbi:hypothetical protein JOM56_009322 [Amanita muscaria]